MAILFELWAGLGLALLFFACAASYLFGCWLTQARCKREELQRRATPSQPLKQGDTTELANYGRNMLRWQKFNDMIHDKGVRRDGGSGDLH
jgi:hypothetical protein